MKIAICDDEAIQLQTIYENVAEWANSQNKQVNISSFNSAKELWIEKQVYEYDLYLLDIQMDGMNGMELAKDIREHNERSVIIFLTGVIDYIYDGFNVDALNYLLKPIKKEQLFSCLDKACEVLQKEEQFITLQVEKETKVLNVKKIAYIESIAHYVDFHYEEEVYHVKMNLSDIENMVPNIMFMKPHRSFLVNMGSIVCIRKKEIQMNDGIMIPIARGKWEEVNARFIAYHKSEGKL